MKNTQQTFTLTTLAAAMAIIFSAGATAEDDEVTRLTKPTSSISAGLGHWFGEREQFGIYDNLRGDDTVLLLDADIRKRDDATGTWMTGRFRNLGIDTRDAELRYERQGNWGIGLDYQQIPRVAPYTINTGVTGVGTEIQTIPDPGIVPGTGTDMTLKTEREGVGLDLNKFLTPELNLRVKFKNEEKDGDRHWGYYPGFGGGGDIAFVAEPIDSTTRQFDAMLEYAGKQFQLTGGYYGSWYDNNNSLLQVNGNGGGGPHYLSLPLDNQAHQIYLNGGYNFTPTTRGTFRVAYTHATQDETIPTSGIAGLAAASAPTSLNGEVNTTLVSLGLSARPMDKLSLVAKLRYHDVDDQTPAALVVPDPPPNSIHVKPNSYETISGQLEGTYRLPDGYSLIGGIEHSQKNRDRPLFLGDATWVPYRTRLDETTYRAQVRKSLSETLNGALAFAHSKRDGSTYVPASAGAVENQINPINIADRDRDKWRVNLDWMPTSKIGLQFNYEHSRDDYGPGSNPYGLSEGKAQLVSVDADFAINPDWRLTAWASWDQTKASQEYNNRSSRLKDTGTSVGVGVDGKASSKLKIGADAQWTRVDSKYDDTALAAYSSGMTPLPDIESTATKLSLFAEYALDRDSDVRLDLIHERWETDDWTWEFSDGSPYIYGATRDGTMVTADPKQTATFVGVSYKLRFQ